MTNEISKKANSVFEQIKKTDENGNEYWSARDLAKVLEYSEYRHFIPVIYRANEACLNSGQPPATIGRIVPTQSNCYYPNAIVTGIQKFEEFEVSWNLLKHKSG